MYDTDPWMEQEALEAERLDTDMEMAEMNRVGNAFHAARKAGRCTHSSTVGYLATPFYPEQEGLTPGQSKCTDGCGAVFDSDEAWYAARDEAVRDFL